MKTSFRDLSISYRLYVNFPTALKSILIIRLYNFKHFTEHEEMPRSTSNTDANKQA